MNKQNRSSNDSDLVENNSQSGMNRLHPRNILTTSTQPYMIPNGTSNITNDRRNFEDYSSGNSSNQCYRDFSSENNTPIASRRTDGGNFDVGNNLENDNSRAETDNHNQPSVLPLLQKLSHKASATLSVRSTTSQYLPLEAKLSPEIIITRQREVLEELFLINKMKDDFLRHRHHSSLN